MTTIAVCIVSRNDLPFLKQCVSAAKEYADEILVADHASTDGTQEWLHQEKIPTSSFSVDVIDRYGFSFMKNQLASTVKSDWIHSLDTDETLSPEQRPLLRPFLTECRTPVVAIKTITYEALPEFQGVTDWAALMGIRKHDEIGHRRIYRPRTGVQWRGWIHEELYAGSTPGTSVCHPSDFKHLHFTNYRTWGSSDEKRAFYSWMLLKAYKTPGLKDWTNSWWYTVYVPEHLKDLEEWAQKHEAVRKARN